MIPLFKKFSLPVLVLFGVFAFGAAAGIFLYDLRESTCKRSYRFINADVICDKQPVLKKTDYIATQNKIMAYIADEKAAGHLTEAAIYFRDLKSGPVFGIDETVDFAPASLLKLPFALVYLTQAERQPELLQGKLQFEGTTGMTQTFIPSESIKADTPYTIEELLARMLRYSDNDAYGLLDEYLKKIGKEDVTKQTYLELGFIDPSSPEDETMSVRQYASIFRALYNISYLDAALSEKALGWLSQSDFTQGLRGGVPESVTIAHKFGERFTDDGKKQLHDCGIVYYPDNPYLLCVMTRGTSFDDLAEVIRHISAEVYTEVNSRRL